MSEPLSFLAPPLVEVSLGILFEQLPGFRTAHFGRFWSAISDEFPETADLPALQALPTGPQFANQPMQLGDWVRLPRVWFVHKDKALLLQVQSDRLYLNWRKVENGAYPRFSGLFPLFMKNLTHWWSFVDSSGIGSLRAKQLEMTYTNQIYESSCKPACNIDQVRGVTGIQN